MRVDLGRRQATGWGTDRLAGIEAVIGSRFADVLIGDGGPNHLAGLKGNDRLSGSGGRDLLDGGPGRDVIDGDQAPTSASKASRIGAVPEQLPALARRAAAGATVTMEVEDMFWGDRFGSVEDLSPEETADRSEAAMASMTS